MSQYAMRAYSVTAVQTKIDGASPHELILMLYDGALRQVRLAKMHMSKGETAAKGECICRASEIIGKGLHASLNEDVGGEVAKNLASLYEYCSYQLLLANARNEVARLDEVISLLEPVRNAWESIRNTSSEMVQVPPAVAAKTTAAAVGG